VPIVRLYVHRPRPVLGCVAGQPVPQVPQMTPPPNKDEPCPTHEWRVMPWQEAYPANSGRACKLCGKVDLGWFGRDVNAPDCSQREALATPDELEALEAGFIHIEQAADDFDNQCGSSFVSPTKQWRKHANTLRSLRLRLSGGKT
jgi:hypothetical protein